MSLESWLAPLKKTFSFIQLGNGNGDKSFLLKTGKGTSAKLKDIEILLQNRLNTEVFPAVPAQVRCFLRDGTLVILVQYPEPAMPYPRKVFRIIRKTLEEEQILVEVQMFLIVQGNVTPTLSGGNARIPDAELAEHIRLQDIGSRNNHSLVRSESGKLAKRKKKSWLLVGAGMTISSIFLYALTRPCVVGKCSAIPRAQKLANESTEIFKQTPLTGEIITAKTELVEAIAVLESIPVWSNYHEDAAYFIDTYEGKLKTLEEVVKALELGGQAAELGKNPPYSVAHWTQVKQMWGEAIAHLNRVKADSEFYTFAQQKIQEYQNNLGIIARQLNKEKQAFNSFKIAQDAAKIAEVRSYAAQSLSNWQLVEATWRTATEQLKLIPPQTTVYAQGQQLYQTYTHRLVAARERKKQEEFALRIYNQALSNAQLAEHSESINQWSAAVAYWQKAIETIQEIPQNSFQSSQALPLISSYTKSWENAQAQLQVALKLEQAKNDLAKTCSAMNKICEYTVEDNNIEVKLTSNYIQDVWQAALVAKAEENVADQVQLLGHISTLEKNLEIISVNAGIPLEVYNAEGVLLVTYNSSR
ncbi:MAG: hypothetical protein DSM107014_11080 [Gomphosphaeria aponina SAG 52.96 = DSM 107014]|uniref:Uncharacterized protein n=1 Tax=Gomphosphaeria aponina SAG 52.96 = DSM 107014 TaxID=1521640 RepID=A0A941GUB4_9CHRO|nr:hypothetical protein [Gomphosphaeria aponina SAG 52.96 = DSM 107014]